MNYRILIVAGGTGGHIFPAIALGRELQAKYEQVQATFLCGERPLERRLYAENGINPIVFPARQLGHGTIRRMMGALAAGTNTARAAKLIVGGRYDVVVGMGGYVTGPAMLAAVMLRRKTVIHEANSIPGKTNRLLAPYVNVVALHFEATAQHLKARKHVTVGMPIRPGITQGSREEAVRLFGLDADRRTLLVLGGSQGAKYLYETLIQAIPELDVPEHDDVQILWSTGTGNFDELNTRLRSTPLQFLSVKLIPFINKMEHALAVADVALARAGAASCAELVSNGVFTLYVPFPSAIYDHQTFNAREMEKANLGMIVSEKELTVSVIVEQITRLLARHRGHVTSPDGLDSTHAAKRLAELVVTL